MHPANHPPEPFRCTSGRLHWRTQGEAYGKQQREA
nr:MAG TPA: hypothetical protein [Caudoviricetes sp.]